jgi:hypothetical protein
MSFWKNGPKSPSIFLSKLMDYLNRGKSSPKMWATFVPNFQKNFPKKAIPQWSKIRPIWSPWSSDRSLQTWLPLGKWYIFKPKIQPIEVKSAKLTRTISQIWYIILGAVKPDWSKEKRLKILKYQVQTKNDNRCRNTCVVVKYKLFGSTFWFNGRTSLSWRFMSTLVCRASNLWTGWPDGKIFRLLGDYLLWTFYEK